VDGFLLTDPEFDDPRLRLLSTAGLPVIVAGRLEPGSPFPWVETDHDRGMISVVEHLVSLGHRQIGFLGGARSFEHVQRRCLRWREAVEAAGLTPGAEVFADADSGGAAQAVLDSEPTAVACTSDTLALALVAAARSRGLSVPQDLSVTGFDDSLLASLSSPALTSVRVDYAEFGEAAAGALLAHISGDQSPPYEPSRPVLVVRASTAGSEISSTRN
jgi:DNA-binding LacI/PurR family transcriptional regulator